MTPSLHIAAAGITRASAWAAHPAPRSPTWETALAIATLVLVVAFSLFLVVISTRQPPRSDGDDNGGWGRGDGPKGPGPDGDHPPGGDPVWWPDFERQFAAYVADAAYVAGGSPQPGASQT